MNLPTPKKSLGKAFTDTGQTFYCFDPRIVLSASKPPRFAAWSALFAGLRSRQSSFQHNGLDELVPPDTGVVPILPAVCNGSQKINLACIIPTAALRQLNPNSEP